MMPPRSAYVKHCSGGLMTADNPATCDIAGGHRSYEKIAFTTCQMSNVCCAMFNVVVKTPDDLLTKPPNPQWETIASSGHFVSESFYKFIGHRTTDIRHLTALAVVDFFTVPMTARGPPTLPSQKET